MSLANDLLKTLSVEEEDKTLVINHYTRSIIIPKSITTLGVENDDDVLRLEFRMPRYLGTVDLSKFSIRVNYINAEGEDGFYKVTDSRVVGDNILFSWLVGPTATAYKGTTSFNVNMVTTDSQSNVLNEYNTAIAKLPVLEGMTVSTDVITRYIDILEQWESRLFGISDTEEAKLIAVSEEEQKNISQHAGVVMASIPADYTTTSKLADKAERTKADAIICSAEGESVVKMDDSSDDKLRGLKIFGKTSQVTTTGKNMLSPFTKGTAISTTNGSTYESSRSAVTDFIPVDFNANPRYHVSGMLNTLYSFTAAYNANREFLGRTAAGANSEITLNASNFSGGTAVGTGDITYIRVSIYENSPTVSGSIYDIDKMKAQLEPGNTATEYEPYSGGVASPSPEWPQELVSIENPNVHIYGNNILPVSEITAYNITATPQPDGSVLYTGTSSGNAWHVYQECYLPITGTYTLTVHNSRPTTKGSLIQLSDEDGVVVKSWIAVETDHTSVFEGVAGGRIRWNIGLEEGDVVNTTVKLIVSVGDTVLPWEPYSGHQIVVPTHTISGIPVSSGGNYTDSNGQQWACDEIDFERGVYVQHFKTVSFTGQENWVQDTNYSCAYRVGAGHISIGGLCTHYPTYFTTEDIGTVPGVYMAYTVNHIITDTRFVNDLNGFTAFLAEEYEAGRPVTVLRRLNEPVEIPLTASEIEAFKALHSNYPTTTVLNDSGASMRVTYNADTKTWIENLIDSKIAAYLEGADS